MKIYVITYSSYMDLELYSESKIATTKEKAQEIFNNYVRDIAGMQRDTESANEVMNYIGMSLLDWGSIMEATFYLTINEKEID